MQRRPFGNTGLEVSILGLGAANLGGVYGDVDERQAIATVHRAFELGVNLFDASPYYGDTRAETVLGKALAALPRAAYVLSTKAGRYGADAFDFTPPRLRRSLDESLQRLGVERVDLFLLHDVEFGELDRILDDSLPALQALKLTGKVGHIGMTGLPLAVFERALTAGAVFDIALSYCHATLFDTTLTNLAPRLQQRGVGLLNASAAAMGLLSNAGPRDWHPASAKIRAACAAAAAICAARGVELAELALAFTATVPGPASTLCGTASPLEIEANARAVRRAPDPDLLAAVQRVLEPIQNMTWPQGNLENQ